MTTSVKANESAAEVRGGAAPQGAESGSAVPPRLDGELRASYFAGDFTVDSSSNPIYAGVSLLLSLDLPVEAVAVAASGSSGFGSSCSFSPVPFESATATLHAPQVTGMLDGKSVGDYEVKITPLSCGPDGTVTRIQGDVTRVVGGNADDPLAGSWTADRPPTTKGARS